MTFFSSKLTFFGKKSIKNKKKILSCQDFFEVFKFCSEWYWTTPKIVRIGIGQLRKMFGFVQYHSEQILSVITFFGVVLDNSKKFFKFCSEWYWTTTKIVRSGIGQLCDRISLRIQKHFSPTIRALGWKE